LSHAFSISSKEEYVLLEEMAKRLNIEAKVKFNNKGFYSLETTNYTSLKFIKDYFFKTLQSRKSLDYRI
jgi:hypothetical protein